MIELKVVTTTHFADIDSVEEFLKNSGAFDARQILDLLDEKELDVEADDPNESVIGRTINRFTLKEVSE